MSTETKGKLLQDIEFVDGKVLRCVKERKGSLNYFREGDEFTIKDLSFRDNEGDLIVPVGDDRFDRYDSDLVHETDTFSALFEEVVQPDTNTPEQEESVSDRLLGATVYTKGMYDEGVLPEKGMTHKGEVITDVSFRQIEGLHPQVLVTFAKSGSFDLTYLDFNSVENKAKSLYTEHMDLHPNEIDYMWDQCSDEYKQAWLTIAGADDE